MKLCATIAAISMVSLAMEQIVPIDNNQLNQNITERQNSDIGKIEDEPASSESFLRVNIGEDFFCFTEEQTKLMKVFSDWKESADERDFCGKTEVDVFTLPLDGLHFIADFESLKKAFHFTELTAHSNHELPMPMIKKFEESKITVGRIKNLKIPADIQDFFKYTIVEKNTDVEQKLAINEENANDKDQTKISGKYGTVNIPNYGRKDLFLNPAGGHYNAQTVNNPRELIKLIKAAQFLNYDVLLKYACAKLASLISVNTAYRTRAILGLNPNGDFTEYSYTDDSGEVVKGMIDLKATTPWFDMDNDGNAEFTDVVAEYKKENVKYVEFTEDYPENWVKYTDKNGKVVKRNPMM